MVVAKMFNVHEASASLHGLTPPPLTPISPQLPPPAGQSPPSLLPPLISPNQSPSSQPSRLSSLISTLSSFSPHPSIPQRPPPLFSPSPHPSPPHLPPTIPLSHLSLLHSLLPFPHLDFPFSPLIPLCVSSPLSPLFPHLSTFISSLTSLLAPFLPLPSPVQPP